MIMRLQSALASFAAMFGEENAQIRFSTSRTTGTQKCWTLVRFSSGAEFILSHKELNQRDTAARLEGLAGNLKEIQTAVIKELLSEMSAAAVDKLHNTFVRNPEAAKVNLLLQSVLKGFLREDETEVRA